MTASPPARAMLGNYELLLRLAVGGMATVYLARQVGAAGFERLVVIKRVHPHLLQNGQFYDMFREEARVASLLHHPNVVPVTNVLEFEGELLLVQEYVESCSASVLVKTVSQAAKRIPVPIAVRIVADTLLGLQAAHDAVDMRGHHLAIVHRDVSPQNIVVGTDGVSRLIDFGIAKARHSLTDTREGSLKGKFGYMSPEQTRGLQLDRRADLFAAGVVLHELLTGVRLFRAENEFDAIRRLNEEPVPNPSQVRPELPASLDPVVQKALERDRDRRFQSAAEFLDALECVISPAPPREVAALVSSCVGDRLNQRKAAVQAMLEGRLEPMHFSEPDERMSSPSHGSAARRISVTMGDAVLPETQISSTHDAPMAQPARPGRAWWIAGAAAFSALALAAVGFGLWRADAVDGSSEVFLGPAASALSLAASPPGPDGSDAGASDAAAQESEAGVIDAGADARSARPPRVVPRPELHSNPYGE
ncbi:MAG TPA: serine/threonine-protein kinase [Polyangiaceae bacterium]|nr:serine/threonine-protein kinase [Polyangiaceae bacterium]